MSATPNYKPSEGKREEFRRYLEKTGVMDALTKVLVSLYEEAEKPEDALEYLRNKLATLAGCETPDALKAQLEEAQAKITQLEQEINDLKCGAPPASEEPEIPPESTEAQPPVEESVVIKQEGIELDAAPPEAAPEAVPEAIPAEAEEKPPE